MPKVSILTPAFNAAKYLSETIDSVLAQTFQDFEMIIVDDGSTDNTREVAQGYAQKHPGKIRYIYQKNAGPAAARNTAIKNSTGEYLALLDSDDLWMPNRLEEGVAVLDAKPEVGLVHAKTIRLVDGKKLAPLKRHLPSLSGRIYRNLITRRANISCLTVLFRRSCLEKIGLFDEAQECIGVEDRDLWVRLSKFYKVQFINKEVGYYRIIAAGISRNSERMMKGKIYVIKKNCSSWLLRRLALASVYKEHADEYLQHGQWTEAKRLYADAITTWPVYLWSWINYIKCLLKAGAKHV